MQRLEAVRAKADQGASMRTVVGPAGLAGSIPAICLQVGNTSDLVRRYVRGGIYIGAYEIDNLLSYSLPQGLVRSMTLMSCVGRFLEVHHVFRLKWECIWVLKNTEAAPVIILKAPEDDSTQLIEGWPYRYRVLLSKTCMREHFPILWSQTLSNRLMGKSDTGVPLPPEDEADIG